jgi:hypothetical protein
LLDNNVHFWNMALDVVFENLSALHAIEWGFVFLFLSFFLHLLLQSSYENT